MKHFSAIVAAFVITAIIGLGIMVIGVSALTNKNTVAIQNSPGSLPASSTNTTSSASSSTSSTSSPAQVQQLQQQINQLQSQLNQDNQALQQYQALLTALQQRGLIRIDQNGNIFVPRGGDDNPFNP